jgi:hypothetical protein
MRKHDKIVANLREQLQLKGFKILSFPKRETMIAEIGHFSLKPKIAHIIFRPDIVLGVNEDLKDRFFIEYVHTRERYVHDLRGMMALSNMIESARGFILVINDDIYVPLKGVRSRKVESMSLSMFLKALDKYPKEVFVRYLEG